jgi:transcriptional regulator with XRE-family HTH domain
MMTPEILLHLRKQRMLTREELAKDIGCSASAIVQWEGGTRAIPDWVAEKMYRTIPIEFTIDELAELYEICRELKIGLHQLFADALRPMIQDRIRQRELKAQKPLSGCPVNAVNPVNNVAEDAPPHEDTKP